MTTFLRRRRAGLAVALASSAVALGLLASPAAAHYALIEDGGGGSVTCY